MSRRYGRSGPNAARSAPFGTDAQPTTHLKIVGGRQVDVKDSPPTSAGSSSSQRSLPPLASGPHGTPPLQLQSPVYRYDTAEEERNPPGHSTFTQKENARNLYSKTAPADKSNSHIHGTSYGDLPGSHKILPPISNIHSGNQSLSPANSPLHPTNNNTIAPNQSSSPAHDILQLTHQPEIRLTEQLKEALDGFDPYIFQDMYKDLAQYDHNLSGSVSQAQANMVALSHKLPLNSTMLKFLFSNFAKDDNPDRINYEKMIQYLARAQLGSAEAETVLQESVNRFVKPASAFQSSDGSASLQDQINKFDRQRQQLDQQLQQQDMEEAQLEHQRQQQQQLQQQKQQQTQYQQQQQQHQQPQVRRTGNGGMPSHQQTSPRGIQQQQQQQQQGRRISNTDTRHTQKQPVTEDIEPTRKPLRTFSDLDDAKLLALIEQQYIQGGEEPTDLLDMKARFKRKDKEQLGTLSKKEIQDVMFALRVPVQGSIMEKLMQRCDTGDGHYSWPALLDFMERVTPLSTGTKHTPEPPPRATTWPTSHREDKVTRPSGNRNTLPPEPGPPPWETRKPLARVHKKSVSDVEQEVTLYDESEDSNLPSHASSANSSGRMASDVQQQSQLEALARQHRARAVRVNQEIQARAAQEAEEKGAKWFERFMHLAKGLYSADSTNTGFLSKDEMHRMVSNYNLIYQLGFPDSRIDRVVSVHTSPNGMVSIEHLVESLRQQLN